MPAREIFDGRSDKACQRLLYDLVALSSYMERCRALLARKFGLAGPQYSILMAVARFQETNGVCPGAVARLLHVSPAFITIEIRKLISRGLIEKRRCLGDGREVRLQVSVTARQLIDRYSSLLRELNEETYGKLTPDEFLSLIDVVEKLVEGAKKSVARVESMDRSLPHGGGTTHSFRPAI
jgi:DNA-binding MarR family transcriptional regulator